MVFWYDNERKILSLVVADESQTLRSAGVGDICSAEGRRIRMNLDTVLMPNGDFVFRNIGGETILVPVSAGVSEMDSLFTLNEVGTVVWKAVEARSSVQEIVTAVLAEFEIGESAAEDDVLEFLDVLIKRDLIRHTEA
jgi:hypothetical protein